MAEKKQDVVSGSELFQQVKGRKGIGIGSEVLTRDIMSKTGMQLIGDAAVIDELLSYRSGYASHILNWTLAEYGWAEWILCMNLWVLMEYAIPVLSKVLDINAFVPGIFYRGEVLYRILIYEGDIWERHPDWMPFFKGLVQNMFTQYDEDELKNRLGERMYTELLALYEKQL